MGMFDKLKDLKKLKDLDSSLAKERMESELNGIKVIVNGKAEIVEITLNMDLDKGKMEAAKAIGMPYGLSMWEIILPQAIRNILPSLVNEFIVLFKETSIVGLISILDLTFKSKGLVATYFNSKPIFFAGAIYYVSVKIFSFYAKVLERKLKEND